jgi:hypothetical protein
MNTTSFGAATAAVDKGVPSADAVARMQLKEETTAATQATSKTRERRMIRVGVKRSPMAGDTGE